MGYNHVHIKSFDLLDVTTQGWWSVPGGYMANVVRAKYAVHHVCSVATIGVTE
jgi:hypothetical protein